jgi:hypothetical protein
MPANATRDRFTAKAPRQVPPADPRRRSPGRSVTGKIQKFVMHEKATVEFGLELEKTA